MRNIANVMIRNCVERLQASYCQTYRSQKDPCAETIGSVANIALQKIATSDAPYHDVEHTILVTLAGQEMLRGKLIREGEVSCQDWINVIVSLLCHDIGYVKGVCSQDRKELRLYSTGIDGKVICLPPDATDASLTPYHVDRGKQFVRENFWRYRQLDVDAIANYIELTRFPVPKDKAHQDTLNYPGLTRAADLIGQLGDPRYLEKMKKLFREFEETGANKGLGYRNTKDLRAGYPNFFWNVVYRYIRDGVSYLEATPEGRQIVSHLYGNVQVVERELLEKERVKCLEFTMARKKMLSKKRSRKELGSEEENALTSCY